MFERHVKKSLKNSLSPAALFSALKYKSEFDKLHPDYFYPDGLIVFCGAQGSGKTLSAVSYAKKLMLAYPEAILVSNVDIKGLDPKRCFDYAGPDSLSVYNNGEHGVIFLIDEIQIDFNSLESKGIDPNVVREICQQRKQRKTIIGTSQVFTRVSKPLREQVKYAVFCSNLLGLLQYNRVVDGQTVIVTDDGQMSANKLKSFFWWHSRALYEQYDTYAKILRMSTNSYDYQAIRRK